MKRNFLSLAALALALLFLLTACNSGAPAETTAPVTDAPSAEVTTDGTTEPPAETRPEPQVLDVKWNRGYVGSDLDLHGFSYLLNTDADGYSYTDVITLEKAGTKLTFTDPKRGETDEQVFAVSSWEELGSTWMLSPQGTNVRGGDPLVMTATDDGILYTYISAVDNEKIRLCYYSGETADTPVTHPAVYSVETDEPGTANSILSEEELFNLWLENDKQRAFYEILKGKTFTVIGDSYLAGSSLGTGRVWPTLLAKKYDMKYKNYAIGGSTVSNYVTNHNPMVDRYNAMAANDPDIVIVEGGRNDYNVSAPIGTLDDTSTKTMMGATRYLLTKIREKYPNALIIGLTCWENGPRRNDAGQVCSDYGNAMLAVCADLGIPCINAMDQDAMGVYMTDSLFRMEYCLAENDISHLNEKGMKKVLPVFEQRIAEIYTAWLEEKTAE